MHLGLQRASIVYRAVIYVIFYIPIAWVYDFFILFAEDI